MKLDINNFISLRVRYGETDQMGYCYYGNYAQYFEVGRVESMRSLGMSYKQLEEVGIMLPVSEFNVNYLAPAFYDDELEIKTMITELTGSKLVFHYEIRNDQNQLISKASTTLVFVNKSTMRPTRPPAEFLALLKSFEIDG